MGSILSVSSLFSGIGGIVETEKSFLSLIVDRYLFQSLSFLRLTDEEFDLLQDILSGCLGWKTANLIHIGSGLALHISVHHKNGVRNDNRIKNLELWIGCSPLALA